MENENIMALIHIVHYTDRLDNDRLMFKYTMSALSSLTMNFSNSIDGMLRTEKTTGLECITLSFTPKFVATSIILKVRLLA